MEAEEDVVSVLVLASTTTKTETAARQRSLPIQAPSRMIPGKSSTVAGPNHPQTITTAHITVRAAAGEFSLPSMPSKVERWVLLLLDLTGLRDPDWVNLPFDTDKSSRRFIPVAMAVVVEPVAALHLSWVKVTRTTGAHSTVPRRLSWVFF